MTYKTTKAIRDTQDNDFCYYEGAIYPRQGLEVSGERLEELLGKGVIVAVDNTQPLPVQEDDRDLEEQEWDQTVPELKAALDELGIKYGSRASKADLVALLKGA
ncbi:HeH/LEM domain-containing protein [Streptococcus danieliae]|uniref:HeH/LEM domain-containing protein n=1 Tax=Streptococcus danieliae TaxID=747656 RepID=UPI0026F2BCDB|nr:HeH/LEM domain-containing protein [Streptococcus danieliae]